MSQLSVLLQEPFERESESARTILGFIRAQMDSQGRRRRTFKQRLSFKGMGCCGPGWIFRQADVNVREEDEETDDHDREQDEETDDHDREQEESNASSIMMIADQDRVVFGSDPECASPIRITSRMNLATALAAERHFRASNEPEVGTDDIVVGPDDDVARTPFRMSLMKLLEDKDGGGSSGGDGRTTTETEGKLSSRGSGNDSVCCVCMVRKKGAAFIPCGHTYCRACSRELWLNRGSCPLCNRTIHEILDIF